MLLEKYVTVKEASLLLGVSQRTIMKYLTDGKLNSILFANKRWIPRTDLEKLLSEK